MCVKTSLKKLRTSKLYKSYSLSSCLENWKTEFEAESLVEL